MSRQPSDHNDTLTDAEHDRVKSLVQVLLNCAAHELDFGDLLRTVHVKDRKNGSSATLTEDELRGALSIAMDLRLVDASDRGSTKWYRCSPEAKLWVQIDGGRNLSERELEREVLLAMKKLGRGDCVVPSNKLVSEVRSNERFRFTQKVDVVDRVARLVERGHATWNPLRTGAGTVADFLCKITAFGEDFLQDNSGATMAAASKHDGTRLPVAQSVKEEPDPTILLFTHPEKAKAEFSTVLNSSLKELLQERSRIKSDFASRGITVTSGIAMKEVVAAAATVLTSIGNTLAQAPFMVWATELELQSFVEDAAAGIEAKAEFASIAVATWRAAVDETKATLSERMLAARSSERRIVERVARCLRSNERAFKQAVQDRENEFRSRGRRDISSNVYAISLRSRIFREELLRLRTAHIETARDLSLGTVPSPHLKLALLNLLKERLTRAYDQDSEAIEELQTLDIDVERAFMNNERTIGTLNQHHEAYHIQATGSVVNIKASVEQANQQIQHNSNVAEDKKNEIASLLQELTTRLEPLLEGHQEECEAIVEASKLAVSQATRQRPNPTLLEASLQSLKVAAEGVRDVASPAADTALKLCAALQALGVL